MRARGSIPPVQLPPPSWRGSSRTARIYRAALASLGPSRWWPARTPLEVCLGAILTQNTSWKGASRAVENLKARGILDRPGEILVLPLEKLEELVRPSGYFRQKALRLRIFMEWLLRECGGRVEGLAAMPLEKARTALLELKGIGPETADSILCYGAGKLVFVVDAYTRRIGGRHGLFEPDLPYDEIRTWFESRLPKNLALYREYHALLVRIGASWCKTRPSCQGCPLSRFKKPGLPKRNRGAPERKNSA